MSDTRNRVFGGDISIYYEARATAHVVFFIDEGRFESFGFVKEMENEKILNRLIETEHFGLDLNDLRHTLESFPFSLSSSVLTHGRNHRVRM